jgi:hypothetical protein
MNKPQRTQREIVAEMSPWHPKHDEYLKRLKKWKEEGHLMKEGFFEEFSFLRKFIYVLSSLPKSPPRQYYVSRIESSLLNYRPMEKKIIPVFGNTMYEYIWLLREDDSVINSSLDWDIGRMIKRIPPEEREEIAFILSGFAYTNAMIIYKSPAGISVPKWIEKQIAYEKAKIHAEVEAIDAEYELPKPPEGPPNQKAKSGEYGFGSCKKPNQKEGRKNRRLHKGEQIKRPKDSLDSHHLDDWFL